MRTVFTIWHLFFSFLERDHFCRRKQCHSADIWCHHGSNGIVLIWPNELLYSNTQTKPQSEPADLFCVKLPTLAVKTPEPFSASKTCHHLPFVCHLAFTFSPLQDSRRESFMSSCYHLGNLRPGQWQQPAAALDCYWEQWLLVSTPEQFVK